MAVKTGNKLAGHMKRVKRIVFVSAGSAKMTFTAKENKFKISTVGTVILHFSKRGAAMNYLIDIFDDSRTWMKLVNHMFIIIGKDRL